MDDMSFEDPLPLNTRIGLRNFLTKGHVRSPVVLGPEECGRLDASHRLQYNHARSAFLKNDLMVRTPQVSLAYKLVRELREWNSGRLIDRRAVMLSGYGGYGKTTTAGAVMKDVFRDMEVLYPEIRFGTTLPIVYVEVPPSSIAKRFVQAFADALELTYADRETTDALTKRVVRSLGDARTQLIVLDELHILSGSRKGQIESVEVLRQLQRTVMATFLYAGVNLPESSLLTGQTGSQITARTYLVELSPFPYQTVGDQALWRGIIESFELQLPLFAHVQGTLVKLDKHLHQLTHGAIGTLSDLICQTANGLIGLGDPTKEMITKALLDERIVDIRANDVRVVEQNQTRSTRKAGDKGDP